MRGYRFRDRPLLWLRVWYDRTLAGLAATYEEVYKARYGGEEK